MATPSVVAGDVMRFEVDVVFEIISVEVMMALTLVIPTSWHGGSFSFVCLVLQKVTLVEYGHGRLRRNM